MLRNRAKLLILLLCVVLIFLLPLALRGSGYFLHLVTIICINVILAVSLRVILITGHLNLGHAAFANIGAYVSALLAVKLGVPFLWSLFAAGLGAALIAFLLGLPTLKLRGIYFGMATFIFAALTRLVIIYADGLTGGPGGIHGIPFPSIFGLKMTARFSLAYLGLFLAGMSVGIIYLIERSQLGRIFKAIRLAPNMAESVGINVMAYNVLAFCVASFFGGVAGAFYAHYITYISPDRFEAFMSAYVLIFNIVGGEANLVGPIIGAIFMTLLSEPFRGYTQYEMIFFSISLMFCILLLPDGLISIPRKIAGLLKSISRNGAMK
jgi:branched-chain amino acid transport system permease protein